MKDLNNLHLWMIIPFVTVQLFIGSDYWLVFPHTTWSIHIHFITITAWYILLITQPYLIAKGSMAKHRTVGMIGFALAGGVGFTALSMLPNTVGFGRFAEAKPEVMGPFTPEFFYSVAISEFILGIAFLFAVYMAIKHRKSKHEHSAWLMSTAFIMLYPAVGRGVQNASIMLNGFENYFVEIIVLPVLISGVIIIGMTLLVAARFSLVRHPAFMIAILVNLSPPILQSFPELVTPMNELVKAVFNLRFEGTTF